MSSACEQLWPICMPVFINVDPAVLMEREREEAENKVRQLEKPNRDAEIQYILLSNEVIKETSEVEEGKRVHVTR